MSGAAGFVMLGLVAAAAAGAIGWELSVAGSARPSASGIPVPAVSAPTRPTDRGARVADLTGGILARPLFSPNRRPSVIDSAPGGATGDEPLPRLAGIMVSPAGRSAIFAGGPRGVVVPVGGRVGRYDVRAIEPGAVTLLGPEGLRTVRPSFDPNRPVPSGGVISVAAPAGGPGSSPGLISPPSPGTVPAAAPAVTGPGSAIPALGLAFPVPGSSQPTADTPQDAMPFDQQPTPSGLDIIRNQASGAPGSPPAGFSTGAPASGLGTGLPPR